MFKDYEKYLSTTLKVYLFVLVMIIIMKLVGLDYFGIDINNPIINKVSNICLKWKFDTLWYSFSLFLQLYFYLRIVSVNMKCSIYSIVGTSLLLIVQLLITYFHIPKYLYTITSMIFMIVIPMLIEKRFFLKRQIIAILIMFFYQFLSLFIRNINIKYENWNFIIDTILNLDQLILLIITERLISKKGEIICGQEAFLSSLRKINLKKSLLKLRKNFQNNLKKFKKKSKVERLTIIIYIFLSLIWNILSVVLILLVAKLNDTIIECIFILTSFWLSKRFFGKAFHFNSMLICFIVSNSTYYCLNRVTTPVGFSIIIPILLGVGLSYVTSKFVKKTYSPLYRGMPIDVFEETILKIVEKDSIKYKICYEFYINKTSDISLSFKYNYSISGIRKIRDRINEKIKKLN